MKYILLLGALIFSSVIGSVWAITGGVYEGLFVTILLYGCSILGIQDYLGE